MERAARELVPVCQPPCTPPLAPADGQGLDGRGLHLRAHVWIEARHLFTRAQAQSFCWLWLLGEDGRVHAVKIAAAHLGSARLPHILQARQAAAGDLPIANDQPLGPLWPLPGAPVVPAPRWSVSWGHPLSVELRRFAAQLDAEVLAALGRLEVPGAFFGSVDNYNRLAWLPAAVRERRLQALDQFPPLIAPLLLDVYGRPDVYGTDEDQPLAHAALGAGIGHPLLTAIDHGRDLIGALAAHYRVGRALIRSPLFREPWAAGFVSHETLQLLDAIPPSARPRQRAALEPQLDLLRVLPIKASEEPDIARLATAFAGGWDAVWSALEGSGPWLRGALRDTRDFLRAALEQCELPPALAQLDLFQLALAWMARRGLPSLLAASRRWHAQPLLERPVHDGLPDAVQPLFGEYRCELGVATELTTRQALRDEGEAMHHCVGSYWRDCVLTPLCVAHLELTDGQTATVSYRHDGFADTPQFIRAELRGPRNDEPTNAHDLLAQVVNHHLNGNALWQRRREAVAEATRLRAIRKPRPPQQVRPVDARSWQELRQVLAWAARQDDWLACKTQLLRGHVAGLPYHDGPAVLDQLADGDALQLVREPRNAHDPSAVRIDWNGRALGYIRRADNAAIAERMDSGQALTARIVHVSVSGTAWHAVEFAIRPA
ncbi:MAG: hypothetical protein JSS41_05390 [Proteobacteria bacterium]|nr:hypothetical protein [Pseudomonadota bacterium]